ncbi:MAG TPA: MmgE/PrpD family protein [Bacillota bacterium]
MGLTRELAEYLSVFDYGDLTPAAVAKVKTCLIDWLAVALAGGAEPAARAVRDHVLADPTPGRSTLLGEGTQVPAAKAALANGMAGHILDYDDVTTFGSGHPSAPVFPAVLALAEEIDAGGKDLLAGAAAGITTMLTLGLPVMPGHYTRGFHNTATFGRLGAAAGACVTAHLPAEACLGALGVAATTASGLRGGFGTMMKGLQVGWASMGGLMAYELARLGMAGPDDLIEGHHGFYAALAPRVDEAALQMVREGLKSGAVRGGPGERVSAEGTLCGRALDSIRLKRFPACFSTHGAIQAAIESRPFLGSLEEIADIECVVHPGCLDIAVNPAPRTGLEVKFSVQYCLALALLDGRVDLRSFEDGRALRAEVTTLAAKVRVIPEPAFAPDRRCRLVIRLDHGGQVESEVRILQALPAEAERKVAGAKLAEAAELQLGSATRGRQITEMIEGLEGLTTVRELTRLLRGRTGMAGTTRKGGSRERGTPLKGNPARG